MEARNHKSINRRSTSFLRETKEDWLGLHDGFYGDAKHSTLAEFGIYNPEEFDAETFSIGNNGYDIAGDESNTDTSWYPKYRKNYEQKLKNFETAEKNQKDIRSNETVFRKSEVERKRYEKQERLKEKEVAARLKRVATADELERKYEAKKLRDIAKKADLFNARQMEEACDEIFGWSKYVFHAAPSGFGGKVEVHFTVDNDSWFGTVVEPGAIDMRMLALHQAYNKVVDISKTKENSNAEIK